MTTTSECRKEMEFWLQVKNVLSSFIFRQKKKPLTMYDAVKCGFLFGWTN